MGCLTRTVFGDFPEYHTSADNLTYVHPTYLANTFEIYTRVIEKLEENFGKFLFNQEKTMIKKSSFEDPVFLNLVKCEPQLGKRNLYHAIGAQTPSQGGNKISNQLACLWVLNYSDGKHSLYEIAELSGYDIKQLENISNVLIDVGLLKEMKKNA